MNTTKAYDQKTPSVAINDEGNVVSVWAGGNVADNSGVLMQQYTISFLGLEGPVMDTFNPHGGGPGHRANHHVVQHPRHPVATQGRSGTWREAHATPLERCRDPCPVSLRPRGSRADG